MADVNHSTIQKRRSQTVFSEHLPSVFPFTALILPQHSTTGWPSFRSFFRHLDPVARLSPSGNELRNAAALYRFAAEGS